MQYDFWATSEENAIMDITDDEDWLCLFTNDNEPRFFCPLHLQYVQNSQYDWLTVFYDSDNPDTQTSLHALNKYYEDMSTPQPLPKTGMRGHHTSDSHKRGHEMSGVLELLPHDMGLRVELDTNETYYLKSGWAERCDGIYGLACGYVDYVEGITWFKDPARIAIMNSHVKLAVPWEEPETETTKQSEDAK
jgi:hypothetical protein